MISEYDFVSQTNDNKYKVLYNSHGEFKMGCEEFGFTILDSNDCILIDNFSNARCMINPGAPDRLCYTYDSETGLFLIKSNYLGEQFYLNVETKMVLPWIIPVYATEKVNFSKNSHSFKFCGVQYSTNTPWIKVANYFKTMEGYCAFRRRQIKAFDNLDENILLQLGELNVSGFNSGVDSEINKLMKKNRQYEEITINIIESNVSSAIKKHSWFHSFWQMLKYPRDRK